MTGLIGGFRNLPESERRVARTVCAAALCEVGYPNGAAPATGQLTDLNVPPRVAYQAWRLAALAVGAEPCSFEEWRPFIEEEFADRPRQLAAWDAYFALHESMGQQ